MRTGRTQHAWTQITGWCQLKYGLDHGAQNEGNCTDVCSGSFGREHLLERGVPACRASFGMRAVWHHHCQPQVGFSDSFRPLYMVSDMMLKAMGAVDIASYECES